MIKAPLCKSEIVIVLLLRKRDDASLFEPVVLFVVRDVLPRRAIAARYNAVICSNLVGC